MSLTDTNCLVNQTLTSSNLESLTSSSPYLNTPPPTKCSRHTLQHYSPGELGKWADLEARELAQVGWETFFYQHQSPHSVNTNIATIHHPAAQCLHKLACAGVDTTLPSTWTPAQRNKAYTRGPHPSATRHFCAFLLADMYDYVQMGFWAVLPYEAIQHYQHLCIAPAGVVPQKERRPRPIMDYTFHGTNQEPVTGVPLHAMQFGTALQHLAYCDRRYGPPLLAKVDLADGYYRVPLAPHTALSLAVIIPSDTDTQRHLIAIPLTLPMGWAHSPPFFCAFTETIADVTNAANYPNNAPSHQLLAQSQVQQLPQEPDFSPTAITLPPFQTAPLAYTDVYIDDFMVVAQRPRHIPMLNTLLHTVDTVFCDPPGTLCRPVISQSKLQKGDAAFSMHKKILGWGINTHHMTILLPSTRLDTLTSLLQDTLRHKRTSKTKWHRLLGTLRSTTPVLYGANHLFSILQHTLIAKPGRIRITHLVTAILRDWLYLATTATQKPVPIHTVVPRPPACVAATDASGLGLGGFWTMPTHNMLWRHALPAAIRRSLVTPANPSGSVTNSV
jgi:hypothetical protein